MSGRFAVLADIDVLLQDATDQTITESLARGESPEHGRIDDPRCPHCAHGWHGMAHERSDFCSCPGAWSDRGPIWAAEEEIIRGELRRQRPADYQRGWSRIYRQITEALSATEEQLGGLRRAAHLMHLHADQFGRLWAAAAGEPLRAIPRHVHIYTASMTTPGPEPVQPPEVSVRDRALLAARTRSTGPARPSAGQAHRPRQHGSTGSHPRSAGPTARRRRT